MSPEERVAAIPLHWMRPEDCGGLQGISDTIANGNEILKAIRTAIAEEREACAKAAESFATKGELNTPEVGYAKQEIAAAIRARK